VSEGEGSTACLNECIEGYDVGRKSKDDSHATESHASTNLALRDYADEGSLPVLVRHVVREDVKHCT
jgi:hypothetical protein